MGALLSCENLRQAFSARTLFEGINLVINEGERIGMIGPNGSGKSTLLKILAGTKTPTDGTRSLRKNARVGYLAQMDEFRPGATVRSALLDASHDESIEDHERYVRVETQLSKLQFVDAEQPVAALSGGWRKRLAIGCVLVQAPDLLLLDEPTNHLDLDGIFWLEQLLKGASFTYLVVSHDRYLLQNSCDRVIELSAVYPQGSFSVDGNYSRFLEKRAEFLDGQARQQQSLASKVRREVEWLQRGPKARTSKAKYRIDEAGRMQADLADLQNRNAQARRAALDFTSSERRANKLLAVLNVSKSMGDRALFSGLSFHLEPGQKLGLLGTNGSGKTTLLRLLTGQLQPDQGEVRRAEGVRVALFDQNRAQLDQNELLRHALAPTGDQVVFQGKPVHIEAWARRFLFRSQQLDLPVSHLSGGEQARVLLARMMLEPADVLMLDEPANDLDIPSLEVLESSLNDFPGAVVLITHDRYLLEEVSTSILGLDGAGGFGFYVSYEHWLEARQAAEAARRPTEKVKPSKPAQPAAAKRKGLSFKEKKELESIEGDIHAAETQVALIQQTLEDPAVVANHVRLRDQCQALEAAQARVNQLFARWEELEALANQ